VALENSYRVGSLHFGSERHITADATEELKLDGYRALAIRTKEGARLLSRNNNDLAKRFPKVTAAVRALEPDTMLDGEIVALDAAGHPSFNVLQNHQTAKTPILYYAFDLLAFRGKSLLQMPLERRRSLLEAALADAEDPLRLCGKIEAEPEPLVSAGREQNVEGFIAKRKSSVYEPGRRSGSWVKYKIQRGQEFVIGGYKPGPDGFENLTVGYYEDGKLMFIGKVRNGFTPRLRREVFAKFEGLDTPQCPFANLPEPKNARRGEALTAEVMKKYRWLKPKLVAQIDYADWTEANHLRHSRFIGLRDDKKPEDVVREAEQ
jgi:DNA ligase D-like protein (predicted ligase)